MHFLLDFISGWKVFKSSFLSNLFNPIYYTLLCYFFRSIIFRSIWTVIIKSWNFSWSIRILIVRIIWSIILISLISHSTIIITFIISHPFLTRNTIISFIKRWSIIVFLMFILIVRIIISFMSSTIVVSLFRTLMMSRVIGNISCFFFFLQAIFIRIYFLDHFGIYHIFLWFLVQLFIKRRKTTLLLIRRILRFGIRIIIIILILIITINFIDLFNICIFTFRIMTLAWVYLLNRTVIARLYILCFHQIWGDESSLILKFRVLIRNLIDFLIFWFIFLLSYNFSLLSFFVLWFVL